MSIELHIPITTINYTINSLEKIGIVKNENKYYKLTDAFLLLQYISMNRPFNSINSKSIRLPFNEVNKIENYINNIFKDNDIKYGFTCFSGLRRYYEYNISYPIIHTYVSDIDIVEKIQKGEGPIPVVVLKPDNDSILKQTLLFNNYYICDKIQIIIDLFSSGIGRDAAYKYLMVLSNEPKSSNSI
jgi:hypothetical protein